jgi:LuxR family maltose regulon positive regulatory protein
MNRDLPHARLFQAKLRPPLDPGRMLPRAALQNPAALTHARLVLVNGPAGFGKTITLCQLHRDLSSQAVPTAWLTLDADDNDLARFTAYLRAALAAVAPGVADVARRDVAHGDRGAVLGEAFEVIDALASSDRPFAIFLDDLERVGDAEVRGVIARLLLTLGPGQRLVIGTRELPDFGLARLRASGQLVEIGPEQLRFTADESRRFVSETHGCTMSADDIAFLHERTEGWPVALQLAVLAHGGEPDGNRRLRAFGGTRAEITDYLAAEVLGRLEPDLRAFLLATSILETFCAELCDAVTGGAGGAQMIERVRRGNLFLVALDGDRLWFRYHSLCAEFLRSRLEATEGSAVAGLHQRAAAWLTAHDRYAQALEHASRSGDAHLPAAILGQCATRWLHEGRVTALLRWTETIAADLLASHPGLLFSAALASVVSHRFREAQRLIEALEVPPAEATGARGRELAMLKFNFAIWSDRLQELRAALDNAVALITPADGFVYASMLNCIAYLGMLESNAEMARSALAAAKASPTHRDNEVVRTYSEGEAAMMHLVRGELRDARGVAEAELERLAGAGSHYGTSSAIVALVLADAHYEANEIAAARVLLDEHLGIAEDTCIPDLIVSGFVTRARVARIEGEPKLADELVGRLQRLGESRGLQRLAASALLEKSRFAISEGRIETAAAQVDDASAASFWSHPAFAGTYGNDLNDAAMGKARLELFRGGTGAIAPLEAQLRAAESLGRARRALKLRGLLAQALWIAGRRQPALRQLREALVLGAPEALVRTLADEPWVLPDMLGHAEVHADAALAAFARRLASACGPSLASKSHPRAVHDADEILSAREVQVLGMLARGLSNKEMARELARSGATVATHLRRIYAKLGAHTRTQAIAIARRNGLIG